MKCDALRRYTLLNHTNPDPISELVAVESGQTLAEPWASEFNRGPFLDCSPQIKPLSMIPYETTLLVCTDLMPNDLK